MENNVSFYLYREDFEDGDCRVSYILNECTLKYDFRRKIRCIKTWNNLDLEKGSERYKQIGSELKKYMQAIKTEIFFPIEGEILSEIERILYPSPELFIDNKTRVLQVNKPDERTFQERLRDDLWETLKKMPVDNES